MACYLLKISGSIKDQDKGRVEKYLEIADYDDELSIEIDDCTDMEYLYNELKKNKIFIVDESKQDNKTVIKCKK